MGCGSRVGLSIMVTYACRIFLALGLGWFEVENDTEKELSVGV